MIVATQRAPEPTTKVLPSVSVLLPAWNDAAMVGRCLDSLVAIEWPDLEIIVCAGGEDGTLDVARQYEGDRVIVLEQKAGEGKQGALRRCFARSQGEIIYLTDADCVVPQDSFQRVVGPIMAGRESIVTSDSRPLDDGVPHLLLRYQQYVDAVTTQRLGDYTIGIHGRNVAIHRQALASAGAFSWSAPTGTDYALAEELHRAGFRVRHVSGADVISEYPTNLASYIRQRTRWLRNIVLLGYRYHRWSLVIPTLAYSIVSTGLAIGPALRFTRWRRLGSAACLGWLALIVKRSADAMRQEYPNRSTAVAVAAVLMTPVEVLICLISIVQLCVPRWKWRW